MPRVGLREASEEIARRSPEMARLMAIHGPCRLGRRPRRDARFGSLARSIVYQQLAGAAAGAIWARVLTVLDGACSARGILEAGPEALRAAGLSAAKTASLMDLAERDLSGDLALESLGRLADDAVAARLTRVRGVGPWTADMFLLFTLHRLDVWPTGDLGVRKGCALAFDLPDVPAPAVLEEFGERFRPYRSVAAWYCWRACEAT
ncbi:MAG: hypothetical protein OXG91_06125 [bacterium]|nr:hypothetical protein [bacterium]